VHVALAEALPTRSATDADIDAISGAWRRRLRIACAEVPAVAPQAAAITDAYAEARGRPWPDLQRIHGDLHLGQVLRVPDGGWRLVDFEGEPLRPMAERTAPDLPPRDVAGMLRSFDDARWRSWVTASSPQHGPRRAVRRSTKLCDGLGRQTLDPVLLRALVLDKAVYESIYEAHRPSR
jgi:predicted trehalose synthase